MRGPRPNLVPTREIDIDRPLRSCLEWLAVRCSLDCCGTDACVLTPGMLEQWSDSAGTERTRAAIAQALEVVRRCDESAEPLSCGPLNYREIGRPAAEDRPARGAEIEKVQGEHRRRLRDFFAALAEALKAYA